MTGDDGRTDVNCEATHFVRAVVTQPTKQPTDAPGDHPESETMFARKTVPKKKKLVARKSVPKAGLKRDKASNADKAAPAKANKTKAKRKINSGVESIFGPLGSNNSSRKKKGDQGFSFGVGRARHVGSVTARPDSNVL